MAVLWNSQGIISSFFYTGFWLIFGGFTEYREMKDVTLDLLRHVTTTISGFRVLPL